MLDSLTPVDDPLTIMFLVLTLPVTGTLLLSVPLKLKLPKSISRNRSSVTGPVGSPSKLKASMEFSKVSPLKSAPVVAVMETVNSPFLVIVRTISSYWNLGLQAAPRLLHFCVTSLNVAVL